MFGIETMSVIVTIDSKWSSATDWSSRACTPALRKIHNTHDGRTTATAKTVVGKIGQHSNTVRRYNTTIRKISLIYSLIHNIRNNTCIVVGQYDIQEIVCTGTAVTWSYQTMVSIILRML